MAIDRRHFLLGAGPALLPAATPPKPRQARPASRKKEEEEEVTPTEDLMREHGVLKRVLLIYDEVRRRMAANAASPPEAVPGRAPVTGSSIEPYPEALAA